MLNTDAGNVLRETGREGGGSSYGVEVAFPSNHVPPTYHPPPLPPLWRPTLSFAVGLYSFFSLFLSAIRQHSLFSSVLSIFPVVPSWPFVVSVRFTHLFILPFELIDYWEPGEAWGIGTL